MEALKIELEAMTTSFRYPHFLVGRQPSFVVPPPATLYGHIASALGEFPDDLSLRFGYSFTCAGKTDDLETQHIVGPSTGKLDKAWGYVKNLEGAANPSLRQVLIQPRLTLYLVADDLARYEGAFHEPRYAVVLGRSQDLATYTGIARVGLEERTEGYFEGTLLSLDYRARTNGGILTQMPRYINPEDRRVVEWATYVVIEGKLTASAERSAVTQNRLFYADQPFWVDPESPTYQGVRRAVQFHSFIEEAVTSNA